jgi:hypothetical protein
LYKLLSDECLTQADVTGPLLHPRSKLLLGAKQLWALGSHQYNSCLDTFYIDVPTCAGVSTIAVTDDFSHLELHGSWWSPTLLNGAAAGPQRVGWLDCSSAGMENARLGLSARAPIAQHEAECRLGEQQRRDFSTSIPESMWTYYGEVQFDEWTGFGIICLDVLGTDTVIVFRV